MKIVQYLLACMLMAAAVSATLFAVPQTDASSGITGVVTWKRTGLIPKDEMKQPPPPYYGPLAVNRSSDRKTVATVSTDEQGEFKVTLPPGEYFISNIGPGIYPFFERKKIKVDPNRYTSVRLTVHNGGK